MATAAAGVSPVSLRLYLLGGFRAERDGAAVAESAWGRPIARTLLKLLAIAPGHRLHREQVVDLLWPDLAPDSALNSFRKALHLARHALDPALPPRGASAFLHLIDDSVVLAPDGVWIDADAFQVLAEAALAGGDEAALGAVLAAYGGELLPEDRYADWAAARREALAALHLAALTRSADLLERRGALTAAGERLRQVVLHDPAHEETHRRLMRLYLLSGSRHQALRQYQACREALAHELDARPEAATEALYREIVAGGPGAMVGGSGAGPAASVAAVPPALRRPPADPLIGRERALALLLEDLDRAVAGQGGLVLVGGEAGVGKSRLMSEAARAAQARGALVLWGAGDEAGGQLPYGAFVEALDGCLAARAPAERQALARDYPEVAGLVPALVPEAGEEPAPANPEHERTRLFAAVGRLLDHLGTGRPLLLALDDLHTVDAASLHLLHYLARTARGRRWLIVGTYREEELATRRELQQLSATATREGYCRRIDLLRLARQDCDRLIQSLLPGGQAGPALLDQLYARSLGNPLFVQELVRTMQEQGALLLVEGRWTAPAADVAVPPQVRDLVEARVQRMDEPVRRVLALAAVAGAESSFGLLRAAGDLAEGPLLDALDGALAAGILEERPDGYAFRHPLLRAALYEQLSQSRRRRLHAALARALEATSGADLGERPDAVEALAHHWAAADEPGQAVPYLLRAAEHAAQVYAGAEALDRFRRALALLDAAGPAFPGRLVRRAAILERIGDLSAVASESGAARAAYADALAACPSDALIEARLQRKAAHQALLAGDLVDAAERLDQAQARLAQVEPGADRDLERARLLAIVAHRHWLAYQFPAALAAAEASAALAEASGAAADLARAYEMMALAYLPLGEWQRGVECERRRASLIDLNREVAEAADVHL